MFIVNENPAAQFRPLQNLLMKVLLVLVTVSVLYSALLCFVPEETGWASDVYRGAYRDIIETAQFWTPIRIRIVSASVRSEEGVPGNSSSPGNADRGI